MFYKGVNHKNTNYIGLSKVSDLKTAAYTFRFKALCF